MAVLAVLAPIGALPEPATVMPCQPPQHRTLMCMPWDAGGTAKNVALLGGVRQWLVAGSAWQVEML